MDENVGVNKDKDTDENENINKVFDDDVIGTLIKTLQFYL